MHGATNQGLNDEKNTWTHVWVRGGTVLPVGSRGCQGQARDDRAVLCWWLCWR